MSHHVKLYLGQKVLEALNRPTGITSLQLGSAFATEYSQAKNLFSFRVASGFLKKNFGVEDIGGVFKIQPDEIIRSVQLQDGGLSFDVSREFFVRSVLEPGGSGFKFAPAPKSIVIDFSSPNIAKPFHMGHLRSTVIGNFIGNLNRFENNNVTRINYLGDWGTQFGFVEVGVDKLSYTEDQIKGNPLKLLHEAYVHANKLSEHDPNILAEARDAFSRLERGEPQSTARWIQYVDYSRSDLEATYKRIGVHFDAYNYESMYNAKNIQDIIKILVDKNIAQKQPLGALEAILDNDKRMTLLKSDGSTLYFSRDIAAAVDRHKKYNFDVMYYVVDNTQAEHFKALRAVLGKMGYGWAGGLHHVNFGRIRGMSTRKGTAVFLKDVLDECKELMVEKQIQSPTTKAAIDDDKTSDILSVSCIIVNDLKRKRQRDYEFNWDQVLQAQGDSGIKLQYTHCRLCGIERNSGVTAATECLPEALQEVEAAHLVREIARFEEVLQETGKQLEGCILVTYLFGLCNHINKAVKVLNVKRAAPDVACQRMLLFKTARETLGKGMTVLGLQPLSQM